MGTEEISPRFQLRYAAGVYWLLDMEQPGLPYKPPAALDEVGAQMWRLVYVLGKTRQEAAQELSREYGVSQEEILGDMQAFFSQLAQQGYPTDEEAE